MTLRIGGSGGVCGGVRESAHAVVGSIPRLGRWQKQRRYLFIYFIYFLIKFLQLAPFPFPRRPYIPVCIDSRRRRRPPFDPSMALRGWIERYRGRLGFIRGPLTRNPFSSSFFFFLSAGDIKMPFCVSDRSRKSSVVSCPV